MRPKAMTSSKKKLGANLIISAIGILLIAAGLWAGSTQSTDIVGTTPNGKSEVLSHFPWQFKERGDAHLTLSFNPTSFSSKIWQIVPDDHLHAISINNQKVDLSQYSLQQLRDYREGFKLDLTPYLITGTNTIQFELSNGPGPGGLKIYPQKGWLNWLIIYLGFFVFSFSLARAFKLNRSQLFAIAIGLVAIIAYWSVTPWDLRSHDADGLTGHFGYVKYVAENLKLPNPTEGWTFYHPPLYYVSGAVIWHVANLINVSPDIALQAYSIILWVIFLVSSLAAINYALRLNPAAQMAASFALVLWPSGIIHSIRIGNDAAYYAISGLSLFYALRWWHTSKHSHLFITAMLCLFAFLTKSNAIVIAALMGSAIILRLLTTHSWKKRRKIFLQGLIFALISSAGIALSFAVRIFYYLRGEIKHWLVGNLGTLNGALRVPNEIKAYLPLDLPTYIVNPFISTWVDETGRGNFWNFLIRSSLTGEFTFTSTPSAVIAVIWGLITICLWGIATKKLLTPSSYSRKRLYRYAPLTLLFAYSLLSLVSLRYMAPYACSNDFRYVLPMITPLLIFWSIQGKGARFMLYAISALSGVFFFTI